MEDLTAVDNQALQAALHPISVSSTSPLATFSNWAKTFTCKPQRVFVPTTILQCRQILELARREGARVHPVGVGHSPSDLACTNGWLVRMERVRGTVKVSVLLYVAVSRALAQFSNTMGMTDKYIYMQNTDR